MTASGQSGDSALLTNGIPEHVAIILDAVNMAIAFEFL